MDAGRCLPGLTDEVRKLRLPPQVWWEPKSSEDLKITVHGDRLRYTLTGCAVYIHIYIYTRKPGRSPTRQYGVLRPFLTCAPSLDFFGVFQEDFSSCNSESGQSRASGWKALDGLTLHVPLEQASRYSFKAVSTEKSPLRSTLNTGYIACLGMCKICTEAVHSVAL